MVSQNKNVLYALLLFDSHETSPITRIGKQCCGSEMFIPDPDFYPSRISDPGFKSSNKREG
jgi:hypothetical protein